MADRSKSRATSGFAAAILFKIHYGTATVYHGNPPLPWIGGVNSRFVYPGLTGARLARFLASPDPMVMPAAERPAEGRYGRGAVKNSMILASKTEYARKFTRCRNCTLFVPP